MAVRTNAGIERQEIPAEIIAASSELIGDVSRYFESTDGARLMSVADLILDHVRWDGVERAVALMRDAYEGRIARRGPLTVEALESGRYLVLDGNSTLTVAIAAGWLQVLCLVSD